LPPRDGNEDGKDVCTREASGDGGEDATDFADAVNRGITRHGPPRA
jgi:hypothetical protein